MFSGSNKNAAATPRAKNGAPGLSFIGPEAVISGDFATGSHLHVDGRIDGHVRCAQLCQGEDGTISGDIVAEEVRIAGLVQGTVSARLVIVEASGRITGDVTYETVTIAAGAQIDGRLARRAALAQGEEAAGLLIATPTGAAPEAKTGALFSGEPTRVQAD
jgi:cytoskeletal protein CcmA (bactofilin family)